MVTHYRPNIMYLWLIFIVSCLVKSFNIRNLELAFKFRNLELEFLSTWGQDDFKTFCNEL